MRLPLFRHTKSGKLDSPTETVDLDGHAYGAAPPKEINNRSVRRMEVKVQDITSQIIKRNVWRTRFGLNLSYKTAADYVEIPAWAEAQLHQILSYPQLKDELDEGEREKYPPGTVFRQDYLRKECGLPAWNQTRQDEETPQDEKESQALADLMKACEERFNRLTGRVEACYQGDGNLKSEGNFYKKIRGQFDISHLLYEKLKVATDAGIFDAAGGEDGLKAYIESCRKTQEDLDEAYLAVAKNADIFETAPHFTFIKELKEACEKSLYQQKMINDAIKERNAPIEKENEEIRARNEALNGENERIKGENEEIKKLNAVIKRANAPIKRKNETIEEQNLDLSTPLPLLPLRPFVEEKKMLPLEPEKPLFPLIIDDIELESLLWSREQQYTDVFSQIEKVRKARKKGLKPDNATIIREVMCAPGAQVSKIGENGWVAYDVKTGIARCWNLKAEEMPQAIQKFEKFAHDRGDFWRAPVWFKGPAKWVTGAETYCRERSIRSSQLFGHTQAFVLSEITQEIVGNTEANYGRGAVAVRLYVLDASGKIRHDTAGKPMFLTWPIWNEAVCESKETPTPKSMLKCFEASKFDGKYEKSFWPSSTMEPWVVNPYAARSGSASEVAPHFGVYLPLDEKGVVKNDLAFDSCLMPTDPQDVARAIALTTPEEIAQSRDVGAIDGYNGSDRLTAEQVIELTKSNEKLMEINERLGLSMDRLNTSTERNADSLDRLGGSVESLDNAVRDTLPSAVAQLKGVIRPSFRRAKRQFKPAV